MWTANLFHLRSGTIGPKLNYESLKWSSSLNETESFSLQLNKSDLPKVDINYWLAPWWAGIVLMWDNVPILGGPILSHTYQDATRVDIACSGIRSVLARRHIIGELANWAGLAKSSLTYKGMSLGTIAQEVVKQAQKKPGGELPIVFTTAPEYVSTFASLSANLPACDYEDGNIDGSDCYWNAATRGNGIGRSFAIIGGKIVYDDNDAAHTRTYMGFNLENITADDILTKLSNVIDGPDIMFFPSLVRDNQLMFEMHHGTERNPRIAQKTTPVWDLTPQNGSVVKYQTVMTGTYMASRVFSLGAGQDTKRIIKVVSNLDGVSKGFPLLEVTHNAGNSENATVVNNHAIAKLKANTNPLLEIQFDVRADGPTPITQFRPGMIVKLVLEGVIGLKDGVHSAILLNINGDHGNTVGMSLQTVDRYLIDDKSRVEDGAV